MEFATHIHGIPARCRVLSYTSFKPMVIYGSGFGDAHPPQPVEFDIEILDQRGRHAPWLEKYVNPAVKARLLEEYRVMKDAEYYEYA